MTLEELETERKAMQAIVEKAAGDLNGKLGALQILDLLIAKEKRALDPVSQA